MGVIAVIGGALPMWYMYCTGNRYVPVPSDKDGTRSVDSGSANAGKLFPNGIHKMTKQSHKCDWYYYGSWITCSTKCMFLQNNFNEDHDEPGADKVNTAVFEKRTAFLKKT